MTGDVDDNKYDLQEAETMIDKVLFNYPPDQNQEQQGSDQPTLETALIATLLAE